MFLMKNISDKYSVTMHVIYLKKINQECWNTNLNKNLFGKILQRRNVQGLSI